MAEARPGNPTSTITESPEPSSSTAVIPGEERVVLRLKLKPKKKKKVGWSTDTVDNEHMNKRKSKCCCIYEKPHVFGESSSDTDDECDHCRGHTEKKKDNDDS